MAEDTAGTTMELMLLSWDAPLRILVVDDNSADFELTREFAESAAPGLFQFEHRSTFEAGLAAMLLGEHDLYLVDFHLGSNTGLDLIREATVGGCDGPKVMYTMSSGREDIEGKAILAGAVDFIEKDRMEPDSLVRLFRNTVARHRAFRTQREEIERLAQSDTSLRIIVNNADGLIVVDSEGRVRFLNPASEEILGRPHAELAGTLLDLPEAGLERTQVFRRPAGEARIVSIRTTHLLWEGEDCRLASLRDVTNERAAHDQLVHAQKMSVVGRLAGGVAHDFNNLLMGILGSIELAQRPGVTTMERDRRLREASATATRAAELTRRLLGTARLRQTEKRAVDLGQVVDEASSVLRSLVGDGIRLEIGSSVDHWVLADPVEIEQVLLNLVSNSHDALGGRGNIAVELASRDGVNVLTVRDDGPGIPEDIQDLIFEPFFTTKEAGSGTGLGLSIVYRIVHEIGGRIALTSQPGLGTAFEVVLPVCEPPADPVESLPTPLPAAEEIEGVVLVVDDEPMVLQVVSSALVAAGLEAHRARDGLVALDFLKDGLRPDLVITDLSMPGMDGFEVADAVAVLSPQTRVVFSSGFGDEALSQRADLPPDTILLRKPFRLSELLAIVRELL